MSASNTNYTEFTKYNNIKFNNQELLKLVFVHRSYVNEHRGSQPEHNERLEFLGDAVLELIVTEYLYNNFPNPEGELTNWRSALVKGETLAIIAKEMHIPEFMLMSRGEEKSGGREKGYLLANTFEALLGALYLDQGYVACKMVVEKNVLVKLNAILENQLFIDPKSRLQEFIQAEYSVTPNYNTISETGPDHAKEYKVEVVMNDTLIAVGTGSSKQAAQISAAQNALKIYQDKIN